MSIISRRVYRRHELRRLLEPQTLALIGASQTPGALGTRTLANMSTFPGILYPVNARHVQLGGRLCYASVADLPEAPDCVVIAVPRDAVLRIVQDCASRGAGAVIIFASGYAETEGAQAAADQTALRDIGRACGMLIVGPNCVGVANRPHGLHAAFAEFSPSPAVGARIGLVSQSGALGLGLSQAAEHGTAISHILTCGNSCDVDVADYVSFLADDPGCDVIALVFEGLEDSGRLVEAAAIARAAGKRIVACKLGDSTAGSAAARFHTGTATDGPGGYAALFRAAGIISVTRIEALLDTAAFFAKAPPASAPGVAIVSGSGGTAILATDAAARHGVPVPQPGEATAALLRVAIPAFGSPRNPCDATAQATRDPDSLRRCADALLADPQYGALVIPWGRAQPLALLTLLDELAQRHGKPVCLGWMSQRLEGSGAAEVEAHAHLALFRSLDACFDAISQWHGLASAMKPA